MSETIETPENEVPESASATVENAEETTETRVHVSDEDFFRINEEVAAMQEAGTLGGVTPKAKVAELTGLRETTVQARRGKMKAALEEAGSPVQLTEFKRGSSGKRKGSDYWATFGNAAQNLAVVQERLKAKQAAEAAKDAEGEAAIAEDSPSE